MKFTWFLQLFLQFAVIKSNSVQLRSTDSKPKLNVTAVRKDSCVNVYCEDDGNSQSIEYVNNGKTQCHINREHNHCGTCQCIFLSKTTTMITVDKEPTKGEEYGCEMIFREKSDFLKIYSCVLYSNGEFVPRPREIKMIQNSNFTKNNQHLPTHKENVNSKIPKSTIIIIVFVCSAIFIICSVIISFYSSSKSCTQPSQYKNHQSHNTDVYVPMIGK